MCVETFTHCPTSCLSTDVMSKHHVGCVAVRLVRRWEGTVVPIAMAHVPMENDKNWQWFPAHLLQSLSPAQREFVTSDREKVSLELPRRPSQMTPSKWRSLTNSSPENQNKHDVSIDCVEWSSLLPRRLLAIQHRARQDRLCPRINYFCAFFYKVKSVLKIWE